MTKIIDLKNSEGQSQTNAITLSEWSSSFHADDELREVFLNMDRAMKYIHDRGYCIQSFDPRQIQILNNSVNQIKFCALLAMPNDFSVRKQLVKEDIYNSVYIQIGIYTKCLYYMSPSVLKENFDSFATFLPEGDVPYYRGVVQRDASVYLSEYALEKKKRDLAALENEVGSGSSGKGRALVKSNGSSIYDDSNDKINDDIYKFDMKMSEAAFISLLIFPTILVVLGIVIMMFMWIGALS